MTDKTDLAHLKDMLAGAEKRMRSRDCSDQNFAVLGRFRVELLKEIKSIDPAGAGEKRTGLSQLEKKIQERASRGAKPANSRSRAR